MQYGYWRLPNVNPRWLEQTDKPECPYCKSKNYHPIEIDIGEYRQYFCVNCEQHFFGKNPSFKEKT